MKFDRVIFLGSSGILYECARMTRNFYGSKMEIKVIETSYTAMKLKYIAEFGNIGEFSDKKAIWEYLRALSGNILLFSINNPYIIPKDLCRLDRFTMINLHHALLPAHPGRNAEAWTIYEQDEKGGITWHQITSDIDQGNVLLQKETRITEDMTSLELLKKCETLAVDSFKEFLPFHNIELCDEIQQKKDGQKNKYRYFAEIPNQGMLELTWGLSKQRAFLNAMNYGAACILGKPKVKYEGVLYTVLFYKFTDLCGDEPDIKNTVKITICGNQKILYLYCRETEDIEIQK